MTRVISVVGWSGSGKTTVIEGLLAGLTARGLRVAVLKHTTHRELETDPLGSDTRRFWDAGAACTVLVAGDRVVHTQRIEMEPALGQTLASLVDVDLVLVEGWKRSDLPKIEVVRAARNPSPLAGLKNRIAWVTDVADLTPRLPTFAPDEIGRLTDYVVAMAVECERYEQGLSEDGSGDGNLA